MCILQAGPALDWWHSNSY